MPQTSILLHRSTAAATTHPHMTSTSTTSTAYHNRSPATAVSKTKVPDTAALYHSHAVGPDQCCSVVIQEIRAPIAAVWSFVRRFDRPQSYKHFVKSCDLLDGEDEAVAVGSLRRVHVISGLPAATSIERLEILDDERRVISFSVVGGDHRLSNYRSVTTLHVAGGGYGGGDGGEEGTVVVESYVVDTPAGNTKDETCVFVDTIVKCNLQSLAHIAENFARREIGI